MTVAQSNWDYSNQQQDDSADDYDEYFMTSSATELVSEFLNKFQTLAAQTADVGAFMGRISLEAYALLKVAIPVGSLTAGSLKIAAKPKSEEFKALMFLRDTMEIKFKEIGKTIADAGLVIAMDLKLHDYKNHVHVPSAHLWQQIDLFWDPKADKSAEDVRRFKQLCSGETESRASPLGILNYIYVHTVEDCTNGGLTPRQTDLLGEFGHLLRKKRMQLSTQFDKEQFDELASGLHLWFTKLENKVAENVLKILEESIQMALAPSSSSSTAPPSTTAGGIASSSSSVSSSSVVGTCSSSSAGGTMPSIKMIFTGEIWCQSGGTAMIIGEQFHEGMQVMVGGTLSWPEMVTAHAIKVNVPARASPGAVDVVVCSPKGQPKVRSNAIRFSYVSLIEPSIDYGFQRLQKLLPKHPNDPERLAKEVILRRAAELAEALYNRFRTLWQSVCATNAAKAGRLLNRDKIPTVEREREKMTK